MQGMAEALISNLPWLVSASSLPQVEPDCPHHLGLPEIEQDKVHTLYLAVMLHTCALTSSWTAFGQTAFPAWLALWRTSLAHHRGPPHSGEGLSAADGIEAQLPSGTRMYLEMLGKSPLGQSPPGTPCLHVLCVCASEGLSNEHVYDGQHLHEACIAPFPNIEVLAAFQILCQAAFAMQGACLVVCQPLSTCMRS